VSRAIVGIGLIVFAFLLLLGYAVFRLQEMSKQ
jgi:Na+-transporting methylmalonyl-CoA/oxaloacetate decarboxylase gamma subunit